MNLARSHNSKKNLAQSDFLACKKTFLLLKTKMDTALSPFRQGRSLEFTGLFERSLISIHSQAGVFFLRLVGGSCNPSGCGIGFLEPQDTGFDKFNERSRLAIVA
jgi:hypothetical protein